MIGLPHDAPLCADCRDTGRVRDPRSADEDGVPDLLPCPRCGAAEEAEMLRGYDSWKCTEPVDERELQAEREAALGDELDPVRARPGAPLLWTTLEEGDDISW